MAEIRGPGEFIRLRRKPATVDGGYGRVPAAVQPADSKPEQPKRGPKDAERLMQAELLGACRELTVSVRQVADVAAGLQPAANGVLLVRLVTLDADGRYSYDGQAVIGSVLVGNHTAAPVTVAAGEHGSSPAGGGVGVQLLDVAERLPMAVNSRAVSIFGTPGGQVSVQAFTGLQAYGAR